MPPPTRLHTWHARASTVRIVTPHVPDYDDRLLRGSYVRTHVLTGVLIRKRRCRCKLFINDTQALDRLFGLDENPRCIKRAFTLMQDHSRSAATTRELTPNELMYLRGDSGYPKPLPRLLHDNAVNPSNNCWQMRHNHVRMAGHSSWHRSSKGWNAARSRPTMTRTTPHPISRHVHLRDIIVARETFCAQPRVVSPRRVRTARQVTDAQPRRTDPHTPGVP